MGEQNPVTYILIHGMGHGGWCWRDVIPFLEEAGHQVLTPDLPGHGQDTTPLTSITFQDYVDRVVNLIDHTPGPIILVGHSLGGLTVSQVAQERASRITRLVYLTALVPLSGQSAMEAIPADSIPPEAMDLSGDAMQLQPGAAYPLFYHDCPPDAVRFAEQSLCAEPVAPMQARVTLAEAFASVPRAYIVCADDRAIHFENQLQMAKKADCDLLLLLQSAHSPFFSMPERLAKYLLFLQFSQIPEKVSLSV